MNGTERKIEIFKPFGEAFELMKRILFQPFDIKKWFLIGFCAWLANLGSGGGGFNYQSNRGGDVQKVSQSISQIPHSALVTGICLLILFVLALFVVFAWLRARGAFMFTDCVVKNRSAVAEPWHEFRKEGNSYFGFSLLVGVVLLVVAALLSLPLVLPIAQDATFFQTHIVYAVSTIAGWALVMVLLLIAWSVLANFMVPIMYVQRRRASEAFGLAMRLIADHPGEILLYWLFLIVLAVASALAACVVTCATCCIAAIPYVGTVILLPVFVLLRAFSLLFLRQFGPNFDVWTSFIPPEFLPILSGAPRVPPPPLSTTTPPPEPPPPAV